MVFTNFAHYYGRDRASRQCGSFPLFTKCRSQTNQHGIWPGNETLRAHAYKIRNGVLHNEQKPQSVVNGLNIDQGEFEAMKTLSGWEAARRDEYPFCAKIKVSA